MIIDLYPLVEKVTASSLILWGIALLINPKIIISLYKTFTNKEKNETLTYFVAGTFLVFGLIIVWIHNDWYWAPSLIVTVLGWILIFKAMFWICFPDKAINFTKKFYGFVENKRFIWFVYAYALLLIAVGLFVLFADTLFYKDISLY